MHAVYSSLTLKSHPSSHNCLWPGVAQDQRTICRRCAEHFPSTFSMQHQCILSSSRLQAANSPWAPCICTAAAQITWRHGLVVAQMCHDRQKSPSLKSVGGKLVNRVYTHRLCVVCVCVCVVWAIPTIASPTQLSLLVRGLAVCV